MNVGEGIKGGSFNHVEPAAGIQLYPEAVDAVAAEWGDLAEFTIAAALDVRSQCSAYACTLNILFSEAKEGRAAELLVDCGDCEMPRLAKGVDAISLAVQDMYRCHQIETETGEVVLPRKVAELWHGDGYAGDREIRTTQANPDYLG
jgi:hypothetical protein